MDALIDIDGVSKAFDGQPVLSGVSVRVPQGGSCVILGQSGSGKTVLLKIVMGLLKADAGTVRIEGRDVGALNESELRALRSDLGILFQSGALFDSMTLFDNVAFPLRERRDLSEAQVVERVNDALALVRLDGHGPKFPGELSGGMQKRAALARAIVSRPKVMLLDEPTAGLDPTTTDVVTDELIRAKTSLGATLLCITYNLQSAFRFADSLALLHEGQIVAQASPEEFQKADHPAVRAFLKDWKQRAKGKV